jgi:Tfp pilus assembly protein PilZ
MPGSHHHLAKDLRKFQRATLKVPIEFGLQVRVDQRKAQKKISEEEVEKKHRGVTAVIGGGGIFIQTGDLLSRGSEIWMKFKMPGEKQLIHADGTVVWLISKHSANKRYPHLGMGIKFNRVDESAVSMIDSYVTKKNRIFRELKFLLSQDNPPMKKINELLTSTYIQDYRSLEDLRKQVDWEMASFRFSRTN